MHQTTASAPSRGKHAYTLVMLFVLGLFFVLGGLNELVANLAPEAMPAFIQQPLEQSGYGLLHAHPVVKWWTRLHNLCNIAAGGLLLACLPGLHRRRALAWRLTLGALAYVALAGLVGTVILTTFLFPVLDSIPEQLPVPPGSMKLAMLAGPLALVLVGALKARFLWRWRAHYAPPAP